MTDDRLWEKANMGRCFKTCPGFVLIGYGKTPRHRSDYYGGRTFHIQRSLETGGTAQHAGPWYLAVGANIILDVFVGVVFG